jgi:hypothetical protein
MYAVINRIMTISKPYKCIYAERINCFERLAQLQKDLKAAEERVSKVAPFDGLGHHNALNDMLARTADYKKEYALCEKIMKMY